MLYLDIVTIHWADMDITFHMVILDKIEIRNHIYHLLFSF
jgi:hypothetical protein